MISLRLHLYVLGKYPQGHNITQARNQDGNWKGFAAAAAAAVSQAWIACYKLCAQITPVEAVPCTHAEDIATG